MAAAAERIHLVSAEGRLVWKLRCGKCGRWGYIGDDEFWGRKTIFCTCGWYGKNDWSDAWLPALLLEKTQ